MNNLWPFRRQEDDLCVVCKTRPRYVDELQFRHPYCGRTCANRAGYNVSPCLLQGCRETGTTLLGGFCSVEHAKQGVRIGQVPGCIQCKLLPQTSGKLCAECAQRTRPNNEPRLSEISNRSAEFKSLTRDWGSDLPQYPWVKKIYEIRYGGDVAAKQVAYRQKLESANNMQEIRTFHASQCICDMGTKGPVLCDWGSCGICNIARSAFKGVAFSVPYNKGRHGEGLYSFKRPSLADQFATSCTSSPFRVMIVCEVILPKRVGLPFLDSDRVFVRESEAIIPKYIIMYGK